MKLIFDEVVADLGGFPQPITPAAPTKRNRHKAGRLTRRVWEAINEGTDTSAVSIEDTQEIEKVEA